MLPSEYRLYQASLAKRCNLIADMYTITIDTPALSDFALAEIERYRLSRLRFLLPVSISAVSLILSLVALLK